VDVRALWRTAAATLAFAIAGFCIVQALQAYPAGSELRTALGDGISRISAQNQRAPPPRNEDVRRVHQQIIPPGRPSISVPILMYHYIRYYGGDDPVLTDLSVTPEELRQQMDWLAANSYHPVDFRDLRAYLAGQRALPSRPVVLTFDDGYADFYTTAYPILAEHGFRAVSYVVSGFVGNPGYMSATQIVSLDREGVEIASHTMSHVDLTRSSPDELVQQLQQPKAYLQSLLGHPVVDFCYPSGRFNAEVVQAVAAAGYQTATTTQPGNDHSLSNALLWGRVRVRSHEPMDTYISNLGPEEPAVDVWIDPFPAPFLPILREVYPITYTRDASPVLAATGRRAPASES
jgi:peptidoglycan/xylan/chitin deacetylase (PgdA/CDA1 family)